MSKTYIIVGAGLAGLFATRTLRYFSNICEDIILTIAI